MKAGPSMAVMVMFAVSCFAQQNSQIVLIVKFEPSFSNPSSFTLREMQDGNFEGVFALYRDHDKSTIESVESRNIGEAKARSIMDFMETYKI